MPFFFLRSALMALVMTHCATAFSFPGASPDDWPSFLGPHRNSTSSESNIRKDWSNGQLNVLWSNKIEGGYAAVSVSNGHVFQFDRIDDQMRLTCRLAQTGESVWTFKYPTDYVDAFDFDNGPRCTPVVDGPYVYLFGAEGMLHCLHTRDGSVCWKIDTTAAYHVAPGFFGVSSTPIIHRDKLIVMIGGSNPPSEPLRPGEMPDITPNGTAIVAFDKLTGNELYRTGDDLASYASPVIATIGDESWGFAFCRSGLIGFDPDEGTLRFSFPWRSRKFYSVNAATPIVVNDHVMITESYGPGAVMLDATSGQPDVVWQDAQRQQSIASHWPTPIVVGAYIYGCHGESRGSAELRCIEAATGRVMWKEPKLERTSLTYVDGHLICLSEGGRLLLVRANPDEFELVTELDLSEQQRNQGAVLRYPCWSAPVVADGRLYIQSKNRLVCFQLCDAVGVPLADQRKSEQLP